MRSPNLKSRAAMEPPPPPGRLLHPDEGFPFRTIISMAAVQFSTGGLFLALTAAGRADTATGWAGVLLLATAVLQGKLALKASQRQRAVRRNPFRRTSFWRAMFVGVIASYLVALAIGPRPCTPYWFATLVCLWYGLTLLPIGADPRVLEAWRRITLRKLPRKITACVALSAGLLPTTELTLRGYDWMRSHDWLATKFVPATGNPTGASIVGVDANSRRRPDGRFHVAVVGDEMVLGPVQSGSSLSQLETLAPGVCVTNFSAPHTGPRLYAAELTARVLACRPDLVLVFVSPGEDVLAESARSELFDWRALAVTKRFTGMAAADAASDADPSFLQSAGRELAVCRTPIDATTQQRWQKALHHLQELVGTCRRRNVDVALVIIPGEFQLNPVLLETLCRRMGYERKDLDLELPQRRLAQFAGDQQIPCVDLLPHLKLCDAPPYEHDKHQWNAAGTEVALHTIAGWIQSRYATTLAPVARIASRQ